MGFDNIGARLVLDDVFNFGGPSCLFRETAVDLKYILRSPSLTPYFLPIPHIFASLDPTWANVLQMRGA